MSDVTGTNLGASAPHRPGMVIGGKFVLLRVIAEGAMGVVYEAKDTLIQRHVAIKLLHPEFTRNPEFIRRFRREAEATASVHHPNVVVVLEMGQRRDGSFFIVQELLTGNDLRVLLAERPQLPIDEALDIMIPVMGALIAAHSVGIVHRDVKPDNIVLSRSPSGETVPKLIDFGVARVHSNQGSHKTTQVGTLLGTLAYMSPEQVKALHPLDARTDVWAVGVVLFELLSGFCPYDGPTEQSIILKIVTEPAPRIEKVVEGLPERFTAIMQRALEPDMALRYPSMQPFRDDLVELVGRGHRLISAPQPATPQAAAPQTATPQAATPQAAVPPPLPAAPPPPQPSTRPPPLAGASSPPPAPQPASLPPLPAAPQLATPPPLPAAPPRPLPATPSQPAPPPLAGPPPPRLPAPPPLPQTALPSPASLQPSALHSPARPASAPPPAKLAVAPAPPRPSAHPPSAPPRPNPPRPPVEIQALPSREPSSHEINEHWLDPDDLVSIEEGPPSREESSTTRQRAALVPRDEMDWDYDRTAQMPRAPGLDAEAAEQALSVNKLREAIALAARALAPRGTTAEMAGRMLLVQAIAHRWLGDYTAAERCALEATRRLPHGSGGWYAALGYLVIARGCLGKGKELLESFEEVSKLEVTEERRSLHVIILCRLAIFLLRVGLPNVAHRISLDAEDLVGEDEGVDAIVRAWLDAARAEVAMHRGDLTTYLRRVESAVESFTVRGDVRNACLQRANIGNAYMQLGAYRRAVAVLEEALRVAEPMELDLTTGVKVNLGFALAQLGQLDRGIEVELAALDDCVRRSYRRFEGFSRIYLASLRLLRGELDAAATLARQALDGLPDRSPSRAYALGTLGRVMLAQRQPAMALRYAQESFDLMSTLGGVEEGESLIRGVYALALQATGNEPEGRRQIAETRRRLLERAARINDAHWRQSFLEGVPDNVWAMRLAAEWLGTDADPPRVNAPAGGAQPPRSR